MSFTHYRPAISSVNRRSCDCRNSVCGDLQFLQSWNLILKDEIHQLLSLGKFCIVTENDAGTCSCTGTLTQNGSLRTCLNRVPQCYSCWVHLAILPHRADKWRCVIVGHFLVLDFFVGFDLLAGFFACKQGQMSRSHVKARLPCRISRLVE